MNWLKPNSLNNSANRWESVKDLPLFNWIKCNEGNVKYVNKDATSRKDDEQYFRKLYDEYLSIYGVGENLKEYLSVKQRLAGFRLDYIIKGDEFLLNMIAIEEIKLQELEKQMSGVNYEDLLNDLRKHLGFWIDSKVITVSEFKSLIDKYYGGSN